MNDFLDRIASVPVDPSLLQEAATGINAGYPGTGSPSELTDPTLFVVTRFRGRGFSTHTLVAVVFRLGALSRLIADGELAHWQLAGPGADGGVTIDGRVFDAAARAPLILNDAPDAQPRFEPGPFRDLLLSLAASSEGDANGPN